MVWDERDWDHDVLALYRALIRLRRDEPALQRGPRQTLHLDTAKQTYAYLRTPPDGAPGASTLVAAFNMSEEAREIQVQLPSRAATPSLLLATSAQPSIGPTAEGVSIALAPMSAAILRV
jgi:glycosidase